MKCDWVQDGKRFICRRCGRLAVGEGPPVGGPPCGWQGQLVTFGGHSLLEVWLSESARAWQCLWCGKRVEAGILERSLFEKFRELGECAKPRPVTLRGSRLSRYAAAVVRWIAAGRPVREDSEVERIAEICRACPEFERGRCRVCGCRLLGRSALVSKVRMATEHCPHGYW